MSALTAITPDPATWDTLISAHADGHFLQLSRWGALKSCFGWETNTVALADAAGTLHAGALILFRPLPLGLGTMAYLPKGPLAPAEWWQNPAQMRPLWAALDAAARRRRARWLKIEAPGEENDQTAEALHAAGFRPAPHGIQPVRTILIDISGDEESILQAMKQKTRYNIRLSERKEVVIREGTRADLASFNAIMAETGERNAFGVHTPDYYAQCYDLFVSTGQAALLLASYAGRDLAGFFVIAAGQTAWYLYGASSDAERERMPTYGLQWAAIRWAKERGCTVYDLWGVPDSDEDTLETQFMNRSDGLWGVYRNKRGFGGRLVRQMPAWDKVYNPFVYSLYRLYLRARGGVNNAG